jgi:hypothetical protein
MLISRTLNFLKICLPVLQLLHESKQADMPKLRWAFREYFALRKHVNPLNAELNPIRQLLALLGAHLILHISRIRVKRTLRHCKSTFYHKKRKQVKNRYVNCWQSAGEDVDARRIRDTVPDLSLSVQVPRSPGVSFDMDMSYARMVRAASLTSYPVRCKILHQCTASLS